MILHVSLSMFLVVAVGWLARRRGLVTLAAVQALGRLVIDVAFPALVFTSFWRTVDVSVLRDRWFVPVSGFAVIALGQGIGRLLAPRVATEPQRPTVAFLVAVANWIFLPLPLAQALYGLPGVQTVLLLNIGAQLALWTVSVPALRGRVAGQGLLAPLANPGLVASLLGLGLAAVAPGRTWLEGEAGVGLGLLRATVQGLTMLGDLTVPLSLLVTGAQLADTDVRAPVGRRALAGVLLGRLVLVPAVVLACLAALQGLGVPMPPVVAGVVLLVAAMPCAVSCGPFVQRFGGDGILTAQAVFWSTLLGLLLVGLAPLGPVR